MKAGRELDDLMATEVMGWVRHDYEAPILGTSDVQKWTEWTDETGSFEAICGVWKPSENIVAALRLLRCVLGTPTWETVDLRWTSSTQKWGVMRSSGNIMVLVRESLAETLPLSICLAMVAALKAKGMDVDT